jgi:hypothetical protein
VVPEAVQPVKESHQRFQNLVSTGHLSPLLLSITFETAVLLLKRSGVIEEEQISVFEDVWCSFHKEVPREGT